jgi:hypothetical protein
MCRIHLAVKVHFIYYYVLNQGGGPLDKIDLPIDPANFELYRIGVFLVSSISISQTILDFLSRFIGL